MKNKNFNVGYFCSTQIGDNILSLKMLYAIKHLYKAKITVFITNPYLKNILEFNFVDKIEIINEENIIEMINKCKLDYLISYISTKHIIKILKKTNVKNIIIKSKFKTIFCCLKCKVVWISLLKKIKNENIENINLYYARKINPEIFDKKIKSLEFNVTLITKQSNKDLVNNFLKKYKIKKFITINPFAISQFNKNSIIFYLKMIKKF